VLTGTILGKQTVHDVEASWVLNHQFVQLHEVSRETTVKGAPAYEALVFLGWDEKRQKYVAHWIDVFGGGFSLREDGLREKSSIPLVFKSEEGAFYTTFVYESGSGDWEWTMDSEENGKTVPFARLRMAKR